MKKIFIRFVALVLLVQTVFFSVSPAIVFADVGPLIDPQTSIEASARKWLYYRAVYECFQKPALVSTRESTITREDIDKGNWFQGDNVTMGYLADEIDGLDGNDGTVHCDDTNLTNGMMAALGWSSGMAVFCAMNEHDSKNQIYPDGKDDNCINSSKFTFASNKNLRDQFRDAVATLPDHPPYYAKSIKPGPDAVATPDALYYWLNRKSLETFCGSGQGMDSGGRTNVVVSPKVVAATYVDPATGKTEDIKYALSGGATGATTINDVYYGPTNDSDDGDNKSCMQLADGTTKTADSFSKYVTGNQWQHSHDILLDSVYPPSQDVIESECGPGPENPRDVSPVYTACIEKIRQNIRVTLAICAASKPLMEDPMTYETRFDQMKARCVSFFGKASGFNPVTRRLLVTKMEKTKAGETDNYNGVKEAADGSSNSCSIEGSFAWMACPMSEGLVQFAKFLGDVIGNMLYTSTSTMFGTDFREAWTSFRNIGLALIIIAGLVMVISQAMGLEILDAYTIRKLMPRLGIAVIGIALSWPLLKIAVDLTNDIGVWMYDLILNPFAGMGWPADLGDSTNLINAVIEWVFVLGSAPALFIGAGLLGWAGILSLLLTIVVALLVGFIVLGVRHLVIMVAILMAPLAIASYVLPGTQKLWKFWKDTLITTLAMYPVIMAFLATGEALSRVTISANSPSGGGDPLLIITSLLVLFAPYFMLPFAFKLAGGLMSSVFSMVNDRSRGILDKAKKFRADTRAYRRGEFASGAKKSSPLLGGYSRRMELARKGAFDFSKAGQSEYRQAARKLTMDTARKRAEEDAGFSLGDTDETRAAIFANSRGDYMKTMTQKYKDNAAAKGETLSHAEATEKADTSMAQLEAGSHSAMGSDVMKAAAMRGQTVLDGAGWWDDDKNQFDLDGFAEASNHLVERGIFRNADLGAMLGENQQRPDMGASSFSQRVDIVDMAVKGKGKLDEDQKKVIRGRTYQAMRNSSAQLANLRTARAVAVEGGERLKDTLGGATNLTGIETKVDGAGNVVGGPAGGFATMSAEDKLTSEFATFANFLDMASSASPVAREQFSKQLETEVEQGELSGDMNALLQPLLQANNGKVTNQQILEYLRGSGSGFAVNPDTGQKVAIAVSAPQELINKFTSRRREYGSSRAEAGATQGAREKPPELGGGL